MTGATKYRVSKDNGETWEETTSRARTFNNLTANTSYDFHVQAFDIDGWGESAELDCRTMASTSSNGASPHGLACASPSSNSVTVSWHARSSADLYRSAEKSAGDTWAESTSRKRTFTDLSPDSRYIIRIQARVGGNWTSSAAIKCATVSPLPPLAPTGLQCLASATSAKLLWSPKSGATRYRVSKDSGATWEETSSRHLTVSGLSAETSYTFEIQAKNSAGWGQSGSKVCETTLLPAPSNLSCAVNLNSIELSWTGPSGATRYRTSEGIGGAWSETTSTSRNFTGLRWEKSFELVVQAGDASDWGGTTSKNCSTPRLPAPSGLSCSATPSSITLSWDAVPTASKYYSHISAADDNYGSTTSTSRVFDDLASNTSYTITIRAETDALESSETVRHTCSTSPVPGPSSVSCVSAASSITLSWDAVEDATRYRISRDSGANWATLTGTSHMFSGLTVSTSYDFEVQSGDADSWDGTTAKSCSTLPLAGPSNLSCAATATSITLSWDAVAGATAHRVSNDGGTTWVAATGTSHEFSDLTVSRSYGLEVQSGDADSWDGTTAKSCSTSPLAGPSNLSCTAAATSITLSWDALAGATRYQVTKDSGTTWVAATGTSHKFDGLASDTSFDFEVQSGDADSWDGTASKSCSTTLPGPSNLSCTAAATSITLSWDAVAGATRYQVTKDDGANWALATGTSHEFSDLVVSTSYDFEVQAGDADSWDGTTSKSCSTSPLAGPSNLSCAATATSITLSWDAVAGATRYQVTKDDGTTWVAATGTFHEFDGLASDSSFNLEVQAGDADSWDGTTAKSCSTPSLPGPSNLSCTATATTITLSWDAVAGATRYQVTKDDGTTWVAAAGTSHEFDGLTSDTSFDFEVQAGDADSWDGTTSKSCSTPSLPGPSNLSCTATATSVTLSWDAVAGATRYQVSLDGQPWWPEANTSHEISSLTVSTSYDLRVQAGDADSWDGIASKSCSTLPLPAPQNPSCAATISSLTLSWDAVTGATRYQVSKDGGTNWVAATGTSHKFDGLASDTSFDLEVQAGDADSWDGIAEKSCSTEFSPCSTATATSVTIQWKTIEGVHKWFTARAIDGGRYVDSQELSADVLTATFTGLDADTSYTFRLWWKASAEADWTEITPSISCSTTQLPGPSNVSCTATATSITLSWDAVPGATRYQVSKDEGTTWVTATGTSHEFSSLAVSTSHDFQVQSGDANSWDGITSKSCSTTQLPGPSKLSCVATATSITLSWEAVSGATRYRVSLDGQPWWPEANTSHEITHLTISTSYGLRVQSGDSTSWHGISSKSCSTSPLPAPTNTSCSGTGTSVTLSWDAVTGATRYQVSKDGGITWVAASGTSHNFAGLTISTSYDLRVQAGDADSWDGTASQSCSTLPLAAPTNLSCAATPTSLTLSWDAVTGATRYQVSKDGGTSWVAATGTSHKFDGLASGTSFELEVQAGDADSWDRIAKKSCSTEASPCSAATATSVTIQWETIEGVHKWFTARAIDGGRYVDSQELAPSVLTATFTGLDADTSYTFRLWWKASAEADWTEITPSISCTTAQFPGPSSLSCTATATSITLSWNAVPGATRYQVSLDGQPWLPESSVSHEFSSLDSNESYELRVQTGDADGWYGISTKTCTTDSI